MKTAIRNLETNVDDIKVKLYHGLDGDYHVTAENMNHDLEPEFQGEFTHEVFNEFEDAKKFYDALRMHIRIGKINI